ncbi:MAG: DUF3168 domain-containing protein [Gammaproteobacteria bacterium]|nr:DUF3168 domain-containing protein [Gammaproteobacteria bacterium]
MGIESGVVARLNAVAAVTILVGDRIVADVLPDNMAHPAIVYQLISTVPYSALNADTGKFQSRVQFTLIADSKADSIQLSDAIKTALQRFQGAVSDITILDSKLLNIFDQSWDQDTQRTARIADFLIIYE